MPIGAPFELFDAVATKIDLQANPLLPQPALKAFCDREKIVLSSFGGLLPITRTPKSAAKLLTALGELETAGCSADTSATQGQLLLKWQLQTDRVVITTSSKEARLREYLATFTLPDLDPAAMAKINAAGAHFRAFWCAEMGEGFAE